MFNFDECSYRIDKLDKENNKLTFEQFRELFYTTDDKANITIDVVYINNKPFYPDGTFRVIDKELDKYNKCYVIGLIQFYDEIGVVLADRRK